jgi:hypothetical protein
MVPAEDYFGGKLKFKQRTVDIHLRASAVADACTCYRSKRLELP